MPTSAQKFSTGYKGTAKPKRKKKEVAGPYRSQSSVPKIRKEATPREHRSVAPTAPGRPPSPPRTNPLLVGPHTTHVGHLTLPSLLGLTTAQIQEQERKGVKASALHALLEGIHDEKTAPSAIEDLIVAASLSPIGPEALVAKLGLTGAARFAEAARAIRASEDAARGADAGAGVARAVGRRVAGKEPSLFGRAVGGAARKAEPKAVAAARKSAAEKAGQLVSKVPKPVRVAGKVGARGVTYPIRHPITSPVAAQVPLAAAHRDPGELLKGAEGKGIYSSVLGTIASGAGHISPVAEEAVNLPAVVLPSAFLSGKAGVNALQGDPTELNKLLDEWKKTGLLPAVAEGNLGEAVSRLGERPIFSGLEASGALSALGRGLGIGARALPGPLQFGERTRAGLPVGDTGLVKGRRYSRDLIRQAGQRAYDRTPYGQQVKPGTLRARRIQKEAQNRFASNAEARRKQVHHEQAIALKGILPRKRGLSVKIGGRLYGKLDRKSADVVNLAVERIIQHPETFHQDLPLYRHLLETARDARREDGSPVLDQHELKQNKELLDQVKRGEDVTHPHRVANVVDAANAFIDMQKPLLKEMVDLGLITEERAAKAQVFSHARVHMQAGHGEPHALYKDLENQQRQIRQDFRGEARARLAPPDANGKPGGFVGAHRTAQARLKTAEAGYVQAERSLATARAKLKDTLASRKTEKGKARVAKRLETAKATVDAAKQRIAAAKAEVRQTRSALKHEEGALVQELRKRTGSIAAELRHHKKNGAVLLDKHGYPLSTEQVLAHLPEGVGTPGFLSARTPTAGDYFQPSLGGATLPKGKLTGASVLAGTKLGGIEALVRQLRRDAGLVHRFHTWNEAITEFGQVIAGVKTFGDVKAHLNSEGVLRDPARLGLDPREKWVAVPRHPYSATKLEKAGAYEHQDPTVHDDAVAQLLSEGLTKGISGKLEDPTPIAFMPLKVAKEFREEAQPSGTGLKAAQAATTTFKKAVLVGSPGFYLGNGFDQALRSVLAGINPAHYVLGYIAEHHLSPEAKAELLAGAHLTSVESMAPHRSVESIATGADLASKGLRAAAAYSRQHGVGPAAARFLPQTFNHLTHALLSTNALLTERLPQMGALGKIVLSEVRDTQGSWARSMRHFNEGAKEFANGTADLKTMTRIQRDLEETFGNYTRMSPSARKVLSTAVPFFTWMRAAYKFVYVTMPAHHPIQTGLITAAARATKAEREAFGLDPEGEKPVETYLQGGIPTDSGGVIPTQQYNSFGFAAQPTEAASRGAFPQIGGIRNALEGKNPFGEPLPGNPSQSEKIVNAFFAFASASFPAVNDFIKEKEGHKVFEPHLSLPHEYDASKVAAARVQRQTISVPVAGESTGGSSSTGGIDYGQVFSGGSGSGGIDYGKVFGGG